jgi:GNAT superfamily N-acetyltransferase
MRQERGAVAKAGMIPPAPVSLRRASPADAEFVLHVTELTMRAYAVAIWGHWDSEGTRASFTPSTHRIAQLRGTDIGCLEWIEEPGAFRLNKLYILPAYQKHGIGGQILHDLIARARKVRKPIRLSVLAVNPALDFYVHRGFRIESKTPERTFMIFEP